MQNVVNDKRMTNNKHLFLYLSLIVGFIILFMASKDAFSAVGTGGALPYEGWLTKLRNSATGPVAFTFGLVGIVVAGSILIFGGELNAFFRTFIFVILVMALLVTANNIMTGLFGGAVVAVDEVGIHYATLTDASLTTRNT